MAPKPRIPKAPKPKLPSKPIVTPTTRQPASRPLPYQSKPAYRSGGPATPGTPSQAPPSIHSIFRRTLIQTTSIIFIAGSCFLLYRDYVQSYDFVKGSSMAPTLSPGAHEKGQEDMVLISRMGVRERLKRGDIVTFWKPHKPDEISIKRVVGMPGDEVYPARGYALEDASVKRLEINDGQSSDGFSGKREKGKVVVPPNHIWVEGDNWRSSFDSNDFGPISMELLDGRASGVWRGWWWKDIVDGRKEKRTRVVEVKEEKKKRGSSLEAALEIIQGTGNAKN